MRDAVRLFFVILALTLAMLRPSRGEAKSLVESKDLPALRPGDVVLIDLGCYACQMISATTKSPFNHSGLVVEAQVDGEADGTDLGEAHDDTHRGVWVAQSLTKTEKIPLADFLRQTKQNGAIMVRRSVELDQIFRDSPSQFRVLAKRLKRIFDREFKDLPFDEAFLWDNKTPDGKELLYCSEMVQKALSRILTRDLPPHPMDFSPFMDYWTRYYHGRVPQGLPGNSPASLEREERLMTVWENGHPNR